MKVIPLEEMRLLFHSWGFNDEGINISATYRRIDKTIGVATVQDL